MALGMVALMFLAKERMTHRDTPDLLSCNDLVEIMRHKLPSLIQTDDDPVASTEDRHRPRQHAKNFAYQRQAPILSALDCNEIRQSRTNASANLYSLVETCKANRLDPYTYLACLFRKLPTPQSADDFEALLPWLWAGIRK